MNFAPYQDDSPEIERALSPPPFADPFNRTKSSPIHQQQYQQQQQQHRSTPPPKQPSPNPHYHQQQQHYPYAPPPNSNGYININNHSSSSRGFGNTAVVSPSDGQYQEYGSGGRADLGAFETSLPLRVDYEAMLAYLLLPPAGGVMLLLLEHKSDYVRFHAWQSSMLFSAIFILHLIFSWSSVISWLMFIGDIVLIAFLSLHAYRDVDSLDHYEVPIFGRLANSFVDDE